MCVLRPMSERMLMAITVSNRLSNVFSSAVDAIPRAGIVAKAGIDEHVDGGDVRYVPDRILEEPIPIHFPWSHLTAVTTHLIRRTVLALILLVLRGFGKGAIVFVGGVLEQAVTD
jgi:hypothetical protein